MQKISDIMMDAITDKTPLTAGLTQVRGVFFFCKAWQLKGLIYSTYPPFSVPPKGDTGNTDKVTMREVLKTNGIR